MGWVGLGWVGLLRTECVADPGTPQPNPTNPHTRPALHSAAGQGSFAQASLELVGGWLRTVHASACNSLISGMIRPPRPKEKRKKNTQERNRERGRRPLQWLARQSSLLKGLIQS